MLPDNKLSELPAPGTILGANSSSKINRLYDSEDGPVALQDPTQGINFQVWSVWGAYGRVWLQAESWEEPIALMNQEVTDITLCFNQNADLHHAWVNTEGKAFLSWYNSLTNTTDVLALPAGTRNPYLILDDKREFNRTNSDVLLFYLDGSGRLIKRRQRDRFQNEFVLDPGPFYELTRSGMNDGLRVQFELWKRTVPFNVAVTTHKLPGTVVLNWVMEGVSKEFKIYRSSTVEGALELVEPIGSVSGTTYTFTDNTPEPDTEYWYVVTADTDMGEWPSNPHHISPVSTSEADPHWGKVVSLLQPIDVLNDAQSVEWLHVGLTSVAADEGRFVGGAFARVGTDDGGIFADDLLSGSDDLTIEMWVKPLSGAITNLVSQRQSELYVGGALANPFELRLNGARVEAYIAGTLVTSTSTVNQGQWQHIAIARAGDGWALYLNGILEAQVSKSVNISVGYTAVGVFDIQNPIERRASVFIDELRITKGVARDIVVPTAPYPIRGEQ